MGATPGSGGTALSQAAWLPVLRTLEMRPWFEGRLVISGAAKVFDNNGRVAEPTTKPAFARSWKGLPCSSKHSVASIRAR
jgi:NAD(P)H-dependent FMN reductase